MDIPNFYIVNHKLEEDQAPLIVAALGLTPVFCAVISDILDARLAHQLASEVFSTKSEDEAFAMAKRIWAETQRPALVLGSADVLDAVYEDGRREGVATSA